MREIALPEALVLDLLNLIDDHVGLLQDIGELDAAEEWAEDRRTIRSELGIEIDGED